MTNKHQFQRFKAKPLQAQRRQLLRSVSRSFYLTIRLLPAAVQTPVAVGYLLARATDTVADTIALPLAERQILLDLLARTLAKTEEETPSWVHAADAAQLSRLTQAFAAQQNNPNERALMLALPECLPMLTQLSEQDGASVRTVLGHITRGQQADLARFDVGLNAMESEEALDEYTWQVAGCVGEFWTTLCEQNLPGYARLPQAVMMALGRQYGMGLQRLNILRDTGEDLANGRCYWPQPTLTQVGLTPQALTLAVQNADVQTLQAMGPIYEQWVQNTQTQLAAGMRYALALKPWRLRLATALPALIGARTLHLLRQAGPMALRQRIKLPRLDMRRLIWQIALGGGSAASLERLFWQTSGEHVT
jgi:farnesyl-diphosphate farnesyltransferase